MRTYKVHRKPFRACNWACADGFKTDRRYGVVYGPNAILESDNVSVTLHDREEWSVAADCCAYCGADA